MAKRFVDTNKYKKPFLRGLPGSYKLLWDFLCLDCDHAGIWIVDFEIAQAYIGNDMQVNKSEALELFNSDEARIVEIEGGKKWFVPSFIEFQYGRLNEKNRLHASVITILRRLNLLNEDLSLKVNKPLTSPLQGAKDKGKETGQGEDFGKSENLLQSDSLVGLMADQFKKQNEGYFFDNDKDPAALAEIAGKIHVWLKLPARFTDFENRESIKTRWGEIIIHIKADSHLSKYSISQINNHFSSITQSFSNARNGTHKQPAAGKPTKPGTGTSRIQKLRDLREEVLAGAKRTEGGQ